MWPFSPRKTEELEQMRTEFTRRMQALEHSIIGERDQLRTELTSRMQTLEQSLLEAIQSLHIPPDLSLLHTELTNKIQALEQSLVEIVQRQHAPLDISQIRAELTSKMKALEQSLTREIQQPRVPPEFSRIIKELENVQRQMSDLFSLISQPSPVSRELALLQERVHELSTLASHFSPILPSGEPKPINDLIKARIDKATAAIKELEEAHAIWLKDQQDHHHKIQKAMDTAQSLLRVSSAHIFPPGEEGVDG